MRKLPLDVLFFCSLIQCISTNPFEGNEDSKQPLKDGAFIVDENRGDELNMLKDLLGNPSGDASVISKIDDGESKKSKVGVNCDKIESNVSAKNRSRILDLCPELREQEYNKHANRVAQILQRDSSNASELEKQKKEFIMAVNQMAHAAGHLPTLDWG